MSLDPKYMISPDLQENFIDKDTGCPLVNGTVTYYSDSSRTTPKNVYVLSGTPPTYTYTDIGNVVTLNNAGATSYLGNDVKIIYYPYDANGDLELYYAEVRNSAGTLQFTREAWPVVSNGGGSSGNNGDSAFSNYIPNGQFLSHNNLVNNGLISSSITNIGYGNWTFERPVGSTATDTVTFVRFASYITNPTAHPRYSVRVVNTGGGSGDGYKDIRVKFYDVNKFGSDTQQFTFKFSAKSTAGNFDVDFVLIKNYGTGGSAQTETSIDTFTINPSYNSFYTSFTFGDNATKTIGSLDDDYLQLAIRLPIGSGFEGEFTDFVLLEGEVTNPAFPDTTTRQSISQFLGGASQIPDYEGRNLYLYEVLTPTGKIWDDSQIGFVFANSCPDIPISYMLADGRYLLTDDYSADFIPYRRLQEKYWDSNTNTPYYGTGGNYAICYFPGQLTPANSIFLTANANGSGSTITDGSTATGFTFTTSHAGVGSALFGANTWVGTPGNSWMQNQANGLTTAPSAGTTTFSVANVYYLAGTAQTPEEFNVAFTDGASLANGSGTAKYWRYYAVGQPYYVWYRTTSETDPAIGGAIGIQVNVSTSDDAAAIAEKTVSAVRNYQSSMISTIAASSMTAGSYFTFGVPSEDFYVWYTIDGAGTDPVVSNHTSIKVELLSTDDANAVALKTLIAINRRQFSIPDYREQFLRGTNMGRDEIGLDGSVPYRFNRNNYKFGADNVGSEQLSFNRNHTHSGALSGSNFYVLDTNIFSASYGNNAGSGYENVSQVSVDIGYSGYGESRPANKYVNYVIKY